MEQNRHALASRQEAVGRQYSSLSSREQQKLKDICYIANRPIGPFQYEEDRLAFKSHALKIIKNYVNALEEHCGIDSMYFCVDYTNFKEPFTVEASKQLQILAVEEMDLGMGQKLMQQKYRSVSETKKGHKTEKTELFNNLMNEGKLSAAFCLIH